MRQQYTPYEDYVAKRARSEVAIPGQPDIYDPNTDPNRRVSMEMAALDAQWSKNITEYEKMNMPRDPLAIAYQKDLMRTRGQELANVEGIRWRKPVLKKGGGFDIWDPQSMQVVPGPTGTVMEGSPNYGKYVGAPGGQDAVATPPTPGVQPPVSPTQQPYYPQTQSWDPFGQATEQYPSTFPTTPGGPIGGNIPMGSNVATNPQGLAQPPTSPVKKRIRPDGTIELYNYESTDLPGQRPARPGEYNPQDVMDLGTQQMYQYNPRYRFPYKEDEE